MTALEQYYWLIPCLFTLGSCLISA